MSDISARFEIFHFHGNHCSCALISKQEVERFPEIELKEIQELKQNAEKRKKEKKKLFLGGLARSLCEQGDRIQQKLSSPHLTSQKKNLLASYCTKQL